MSGPSYFDGGPEGIRTLDLRLDRAACLTATLRGLKNKKLELVPIVDCNNMASPCQVDSPYGNLFSRRLHMGSRDKSHRESKKPKKDSSKKVLPTTISPIYVPPATVEVVKKGKKEKPEE
jgi:hypothetical protein